MDSKHIVYILHGEDEFSIAARIEELEAQLGDPATAALNVTRQEGAAFQPDQITALAGAAPFLADRRLVVIRSGIGKLAGKETQEKFLRQLEKLPESALVILAENQTLPPPDRKKEREHWLVEWGHAHPERAYVQQFASPLGAEWNRRVAGLAASAGSQIKNEAAQLLFQLTDGDLRLAKQEVEKLAAYVSYQRPIEAADVEMLTADVNHGDIFKLVDALGGQDRRFALSMLGRLLEYQDYYSVFGMIVRQFRLLIQVREALDAGGGRREVENALRGQAPAFLIDRLMTQARRFSSAGLVRIYHRLLECDTDVKSGKMGGELALETLVASLEDSPGQRQ